MYLSLLDVHRQYETIDNKYVDAVTQIGFTNNIAGMQGCHAVYWPQTDTVTLIYDQPVVKINDLQVSVNRVDKLHSKAVVKESALSFRFQTRNTGSGILNTLISYIPYGEYINTGMDIWSGLKPAPNAMDIEISYGSDYDDQIKRYSGKTVTGVFPNSGNNYLNTNGDYMRIKVRIVKPNGATVGWHYNYKYSGEVN